jgi:hypothetical protein
VALAAIATVARLAMKARVDRIDICLSSFFGNGTENETQNTLLMGFDEQNQ